MPISTTTIEPTKQDKTKSRPIDNHPKPFTILAAANSLLNHFNTRRTQQDKTGHLQTPEVTRLLTLLPVTNVW